MADWEQQRHRSPRGQGGSGGTSPVHLHWIMHWLGLDDPGGPVYLAWSGVLGDLTELAVIGALITVIRRHTCHEPHCWRVGHALVDDRGTLSCWRHHPEGRPRRGHVRHRHRETREEDHD